MLKYVYFKKSPIKPFKKPLKKEKIGLLGPFAKKKLLKNAINLDSYKNVLTFAAQNLKIMYAIVEIAGNQYRVEAGSEIFVNRLAAEEGSSVSFDRVLLTGEGSNVRIGSPTVNGTSVRATVLQHLKGDKVLVFKKKRRKGYQKMNGFRPYLTKIKIETVA